MSWNTHGLILSYRQKKLNIWNFLVLVDFEVHKIKKI